MLKYKLFHVLCCRYKKLVGNDLKLVGMGMAGGSTFVVLNFGNIPNKCSK